MDTPPTKSAVDTVSLGMEADAEATLLRMELRRHGFFGEDLEKIVTVAGTHTALRLREETAALHASLSELKRNERRAINDAINVAKEAWFKVPSVPVRGSSAARLPACTWW